MANKNCPKCGSVYTESDEACLQCGYVFLTATEASKAKTKSSGQKEEVITSSEIIEGYKSDINFKKRRSVSNFFKALGIVCVAIGGLSMISTVITALRYFLLNIIWGQETLPELTVIGMLIPIVFVMISFMKMMSFIYKCIEQTGIWYWCEDNDIDLIPTIETSLCSDNANNLSSDLSVLKAYFCNKFRFINAKALWTHIFRVVAEIIMYCLCGVYLDALKHRLYLSYSTEPYKGILVSDWLQMDEAQRMIARMEEYRRLLLEGSAAVGIIVGGFIGILLLYLGVNVIFNALLKRAQMQEAHWVNRTFSEKAYLRYLIKYVDHKKRKQEE